MYGLDAYGWVVVAAIMCLVGAIHAQLASLFYHLDDINDCVQYVTLLVACATTILKLYGIMWYRGTIWTCVQMTRMDCLSYGWHRTRTLETGRARLRYLSTMAFAIWSTNIVLWVLTPLMLWGRFNDVTFKDGRTRRYRVNVFNYNFLVAGDSHDKYFAVAYPLESFFMITWAYAELTFDLLLISLCTAVSYQLTTVADSFAELGVTREESSASGK